MRADYHLVWNCSREVSGKLHWASVSPLGWTVGVEVNEPILRGGEVIMGSGADCAMLGDSTSGSTLGSAVLQYRTNTAAAALVALATGLSWCQKWWDYGGGDWGGQTGSCSLSLVMSYTGSYSCLDR